MNGHPVSKANHVEVVRLIKGELKIVFIKTGELMIMFDCILQGYLMLNIRLIYTGLLLCCLHFWLGRNRYANLLSSLHPT